MTPAEYQMDTGVGSRIAIVKLSGGLGNQMFQYAFYLRLIEEGTFDEVSLDTVNGFGRSPDHFGVDLFRVFPKTRSANTATARELKEFVTLQERVRLRLKRRLPFVESKYFVHHDLTYREDVFGRSTSTYFDGYWQSFKYFPRSDAVVRETFDYGSIYRSELAQLDGEVLQGIARQDTVGIHVRGRDYLSNSNTYRMLGSVLSPQYYAAAIEYMTARLGNPRFYVFTDDPPLARTMIGNDPRCIIIEPLLEKDNYFLGMHLLSKCTHTIIGNSTFAWWGAWLNTSDDQIVCAPSEWIRGVHSRIGDILPERYISIAP